MSARFCLACGARLVTAVVDGRRRRRCPRCGWTFYANPVPATAALVVARGRVLLARRARPPYAGTWDLPGGFLEAGETPLAGVRRELREELGVGVRTTALVDFTTDRYGLRGFAVLTIVYRVTPTSSKVRAKDDVSEVRWFRPRDLPFRDIAFPGLRRFLRRYFTKPRAHEITRVRTVASESRLRRRNRVLGEARRSAPSGARRLSEGAVEAPSERSYGQETPGASW